MIQLNLLPDVKREFLRTQQTRVKVISGAFFLSIAAVALTVAVTLWVYGAQALQKKLLTDNINKSYAELQQVKDIDKYVTIQNQLASLTALHDDKNLLSRLFDYLPSINSGVKLNTLAVDSETKSLTFDGQTTDYTSLLVFRDTLAGASLVYKDEANTEQKTTLFDSVTIDASGVGTTDGGGSIVSFKITVVYTEKAFKSAAKNPTITVPKQETTPSALGAPSSIFEPTKETQ